MMAVSKAALDRKSSMTKPSIPVGVICSQSGPYQAMGQEILKSALMAIDEINNHPDFDFSFTGHVRDPRGVITEYHTVCDDLIRNTGVEHIIGCYTSASRKQVLPIVERTDRLLWYPARYEGFECSDNVIYVGASPNHNVLPLVRYMLDNISRHVFCVGSNYVWTWETNRVTRELVTAAQGSILAERLLELGGMDGEAQGPEEGVFGRLHESEEVGKVHDAGHVGIGELHRPRQLEFVGHGRRRF